MVARTEVPSPATATDNAFLPRGNSPTTPGALTAGSPREDDLAAGIPFSPSYNLKEVI